MAAPDSNCLRLSGLVPVRVTGADAVAFVNSQVTADVAALEPGRIALAAWCTPKGRVDFLFRIARTDDGLWLMVRADALERCLPRLALFVLRSDVTIASPTETGLALYVVAEGSALDDSATRFVDADGRRGLVVAEAGGTGPDGQPAFDRADVAAGIPVLPEALAGEFLPQALNLEALEGLSYRKGCYPGQEVIARLHYRGEVKRALATLSGTAGTDPAPAPGERLYVPDAGTGTSVGLVTFGANDAGEAIVQAVIERAAPPALVTEQGARLTVESRTLTEA